MPPLTPKSRNLHGTDIVIDYNAMVTSGPDTDMLETHEINAWEKGISDAGGLHDQFSKWHGEGRLEFVSHIYDSESPQRIKILAQEVRDRFDHFVVLGIGGSILPAKAIVSALTSPFFNSFSKADRKGAPQIFFCDNIDPIFFHDLLKTIDPKKTVFNVVSKSGSTVETMAQFTIAHDWLSKGMSAAEVPDHFIITTDPKKGDLRALCNALDLEGLALPSGIGGRFSALTAVGLFAAAVAGIDIDLILAGAHAMDQRCQRRSIWENPAYMGSLMLHEYESKHHKDQIVLFSYGNALNDFNSWLAQLIAESLGKNGQGFTPISARGATDQHSLLQLFLDGPNHSIFYLFHPQQFPDAVPVPPLPKTFALYEAFSGFTDQSLASLLEIERQSIEAALYSRNRPVVTVHCPRLDATVMGQCLFLFQFQISFLGFLRQVNPFDQPAVELGKNVTYHLLGRKNYETRPASLASLKNKDKRLIF